MKTILSFVIAASLVTQVSSAQTPAAKPVAKPVAKPTAQATATQAEVFYRQGLAAEKAGDPAAAQQAYTAALKANPNHANARYSLGQLQINSGAIAAKGREAKLAAVTIPEFRLDTATLQESLDALSVLIEKQSKNQTSPNFIIQDPKNELTGFKISLNLKSMPATAVLQYLLTQAAAKARYDEHAIVITPK